MRRSILLGTMLVLLCGTVVKGQPVNRVLESPGYLERKASVGGIRLELRGIYVYSGLLWLVFDAGNRSAIDFRSGPMRFEIRDRHVLRRRARQEIRLSPVVRREKSGFGSRFDGPALLWVDAESAIEGSRAGDRMGGKEWGQAVGAAGAGEYVIKSEKAEVMENFFGGQVGPGVARLTEIMGRLIRDGRIGPVHICLYLALWRCSQPDGSFFVRRAEVMGLAKIKGRTTYYRVMGDLSRWGYITYERSFSRKGESEVRMG